jgi:hypothetical protein
MFQKQTHYSFHLLKTSGDTTYPSKYGLFFLYLSQTLPSVVHTHWFQFKLSHSLCISSQRFPHHFQFHKPGWDHLTTSKVREEDQVQYWLHHGFSEAKISNLNISEKVFFPANVLSEIFFITRLVYQPLARRQPLIAPESAWHCKAGYLVLRVYVPRKLYRGKHQKQVLSTFFATKSKRHSINKLNATFSIL